MIERKKLDNGFEYIEIVNRCSSAKIALQGAHIFHYERKNEEPILWLSDVSDFKLGSAIRGGIPVCWPSFGMNNPALPQHGFARVAMWKLQSSKEIDANTTEVVFIFNDTEETLGMWNYKFEVELKVTIGDKLTVQLTTTNKDKKAFELTQALHTYFNVSAITNIKIKGLDKKPYLDALTSKQCIQEGDISFEGEFDAVYQAVDNEILLEDNNKTVHIQNEGSLSVVVWNPWIEKCSRMSGMDKKAYKKFVCIETANAYEDKKNLNPHAKHTLQATIN